MRNLTSSNQACRQLRICKVGKQAGLSYLRIKSLCSRLQRATRTKSGTRRLKWHKIYKLNVKTIWIADTRFSHKEISLRCQKQGQSQQHLALKRNITKRLVQLIPSLIVGAANLSSHVSRRSRRFA